MNITLEEAKIIKAAFGAFERESRSDEPHWTYETEYKNLWRRVKDFIDIENNKKALETGLNK